MPIHNSLNLTLQQRCTWNVMHIIHTVGNRLAHVNSLVMYGQLRGKCKQLVKLPISNLKCPTGKIESTI